MQCLVFSHVHDEILEASEDNVKVKFQGKISDIMIKRKVNARAIISELRATCFRVPLCRMAAMPVVRYALKTENLKLEGEFFNGYQDGHCVFYSFVTNGRCLSQDVALDLFSKL